MKSNYSIILKGFILSILISASLPSRAGNYTWTGTTSTAWSTSTNWSPNGTVTSNDTVTIVTHTNLPVLAANTTVKKFTMTSGTLDCNGYTFTITANATFTAGAINNGTVTCSGTGTLTFTATTFGAAVNATGNSILLNGCKFNSTFTAVKKGTSSDNGVGGNVFSGAVSITESGTGNLVLSNSSSAPDTFNAALTLITSTTGGIYIAHQGAGNLFNDITCSTGRIYFNTYGTSSFIGNISLNSISVGISFGSSTGSSTLASGKSISIGGSGFTGGYLTLRGFVQNGTSPSISLPVTGTGELHIESGSVFNANLKVSAPELDLSGAKFYGTDSLTHTGSNNASSSGCYFGGPTYISNTSSVTNYTFTIGLSGTDTFATTATINDVGIGSIGVKNALFLGTTLFKNSITGTLSNRFFVASGGTVRIKSGLTLDCVHSGMTFGNSSGTTILDTSATISLISGFAGELDLLGVTQNNTTAISFNMSTNTASGNNTILVLGTGTVFNGNFTYLGQRLQLNGATFNGSATFTRFSQQLDVCTGGNTFNGTTLICDSVNATSSNRVFKLANASADDFNGNVTFKQYGTGASAATMKLYPAYGANSTFAGNVTVESNNVPVEFGANGGKVILDGSGTQLLSKSGSYIPAFKRIQVNKSAGIISLSYPLALADTLFLTKGIIATDTTNLITVPDNGIVSGGSDSSYIHGPLQKIGNDAFIFALGDSVLHSGAYHPFGISAPGSGSDAFTARYFPYEQILGDSMDTSLIYISECENWTLNRNSGSSNVTVKLGWNISGCPVYYLEDMAVAKWNGTKWADLGNSGTTGNLSKGIVSSNSVTAIGVYTLGVGGTGNHCLVTEPGLHISAGTHASQLPGILNSTFDGNISGQEDVWLHGDFIIDVDWNILNTCSVHVEECSEIVVERGVLLNVQNSSLIKCTNMWHRIKLEPGSQLEFNNSRISGADIGVYCVQTDLYQTIFNLEGNGGITDSRVGVFVEINSNHAFNNIIGNVTGQIITRGGNFNNQCATQPVIGALPYAALELNDIILDVGNDGALRNSFSELNIGITSNRCILKVTNTQFQNIYIDAAYAPLGNTFDGTAVHCFGGSSIYSLDLTKGTNGTISTNVYRGVYTDNITANIHEMEMYVQFTGVFTTACSQTLNTLVESSIIQVDGSSTDIAFYGIDWRNNAGAAKMEVSKNEITISGKPIMKGVCIREAYAGTTSANYLISDNLIHMTDGDVGIDLIACNSPHVNFNAIDRLGTSAFNPTFIGIRSQGCDRPVIKCNQVEGNGVLQTRGIGSYGSGNNYLGGYVHCNYVRETFRGIEFLGVQASTDFKANSMTNHDAGLFLNSNCIIGPQISQGNSWSGSFGTCPADNRNNSSVPIILANEIRVHSGGSNFLPTYCDGSHGIWFRNIGGLSWGCYNDPSAAPDCGFNPDLIYADDQVTEIDTSIAHSHVGTTDFDTESRQMLKKYLYNKLDNYPALLSSDTILDNFYDALSGSQYEFLKDVEDLDDIIYANDSDFTANEMYFDSTIDTLTSVFLYNNSLIAAGDSATDSLLSINEDVLDSINSTLFDTKDIEDDRSSLREEQISAAYEVNAGISTTDTIAVLEKAINEIYFTTVAQNNFDFTDPQIDELWEIANVCPFVGGASVFRARSLYSLVTDTVVYNDSTLCSGTGFRRASITNNHVEVETSALIIPNPASESATLKFEMNVASSSCMLIITDLAGRNLQQYQLPCNKGEYSFSTSYLSSGLYLYKLLSEGSVVKEGKLVINR
ncbi:MAG: T9SS type A sorting domain-containing protein [Bacteroidota bacterium]